MTSRSISHTDILTLKIGATEAYSEKFGLPVGQVADMFLDAEVYPYISENAVLLSTKSFKFMASIIDEVFDLRQ